MHGESNKYEGFNNLIQMIKKIWEIAQYTRATPSSSLVFSIKIFVAASLSIFFKGRMSRKKGGFWGQRTYIFDKEQPYILYMLKKQKAYQL